jgi:hypothetical protein
MRLIEITPNKFINADQIVTVDYEPAKTQDAEKLDSSDYNLPKTVKMATPATLRIVFSNGNEIERKGTDANELFDALGGKPSEQP